MPAPPRPTTSGGRQRVVGAILAMEGRVLLAHRQPRRSCRPDRWDLPGGHVEAGESPQAAVGRELREELGVDAEAAQYAIWEFCTCRAPDAPPTPLGARRASPVATFS